MKLLLTGRAGSGKTHAILERLVPLLRERRGRGLLLLLPTQGQVDHLRDVLLRRGLPAFRDDFAHTFFTLSRSLAGVPAERLLPEAGKDAILADLLRAETLPAFERIRDTRGFRRLLSAALKELKQNGLTPRDYEAQAWPALEEGGRAQARHRDLGRTFSAYAARLERCGRIDQEDLELLAMERLDSGDRSEWKEMLFLVDGFHDFTRVQLGILRRLAERCAETVCTLGFDAALPEHPPFEVSGETRDALLQMGFAERSLPGNRRSQARALSILERQLFGESSGGAPDDGSLRLLRAASRESEMESIARTILRRVREEGAAYRDMAVLYHDLPPVIDLLEGTFRRFGIPLRVTRARPLEGRPIVRFLLDLGALLAQGPQPDLLFRLARSGFLARVPPEETDQLEEMVRAEGAPDSPDMWLQRCRAGGLPRMEDLLATLKRAGERARGKHPRATLAALWIGCFEEIALPFAEEGGEDALECAALREFLALFDALEGVHPRAPVTLGILLTEMREAAAVATFRVVDRRREAVNAIDAREARQWEVADLFVAGALERQFPPAPIEDLFLDDADRALLNRRGFRFPDRRRRQAEETLLFYTAVTRATKRLQISHAAGDADGNPTLPSFFLREVMRHLDPAERGKIVDERPPGRILPPPEEMVLREDLDRAIHLGLGVRHPRGTAPPEVSLAASLYALRRSDEAFRADLRAALLGIEAALVDPALRAEAGRRDAAFSPSTLAALCQCPYLHFARQTLRLKPLPARHLEALDLGAVLHDTLRDVFQAAEGADPLTILAEHFERTARPRKRTFRIRAEKWRLQAALAAVLQAEKERATPLRPRLFEVSFGTKEGDRPPLYLVAGDREERLSGRIDRIDVDPSGRRGYVVDYKYSDPPGVGRVFAAATAPEMAAFQIAIYLMALQEVLGLEPVGAELLSTRREVRRFAIGRSELVDQWDPTKSSLCLEEAEYSGYLERACRTIAALVASARAGDIATRPRDTKQCGPGNCDAADVCRHDPWLVPTGSGA